MSPKVSVIIPVYNCEKYLSRCIESVIQQSYSNLEIIVINDGSVDKSGKICEKYSQLDGRIKYLYQVNSGVSIARNVGLDNCTGTWITFLDADDFLERNAVELFLKIAYENEADLVMLGAKVIGFNGIEYETSPENEKLNSDEILDKILKDEITNHVIMRLYSKSLWNGIRFPVGVVYEDLYIAPYVFSKAEKIIYKAIPVYNYNRMNEDSLTSSKNDFNAFHRYSKFLAYKAHACLGCELKKREVVEWGIKKALHEIIKCMVINSAKPVVADDRIKEMIDYLEQHRKYLSALKIRDQLLGWSILDLQVIYIAYGKLKSILYKIKCTRARG